MIRDPSDGSVREKSAIGIPITGLAPAMTQHQTQELQRLERSRKWLSDRRTNSEKPAIGETRE